MNFSWFEERRVAGSRGPRNDPDLRFLFDSGIRTLVRLEFESETGVSTADVENVGLVDCYEPVTDFTAPSQHQIDRVIAFIRESIRRDKPVDISCKAGYGRTGTILACYLVSAGMSAEESIRKTIELRPSSREILQVPGATDAIIEFERRLKVKASNAPSN